MAGQFANENVGCLPGKLYSDIKDYLDVSHDRMRALIAVFDGKYTITNQHRAGRTLKTEDLIFHLRRLDMTIQEFAGYALLAGDQYLLDILNLDVPAAIVETSPPQVFVTDGEPVRLSVRALGHPAPHFQWYKDDQPLHGQNESTYSVHSASVADCGFYVCEAVNPLNNQAQRSKHYVYVDVPAPIEIRYHPRQCRVDLGGDALFRCEVVNPEGVAYQWFKDDVPLQDSAYIKGSSSSELRLYHLDSSIWQGSYFCEVSKGRQSERSQGAPLLLRVNSEIWPPLPEYTATDKVALLIGCNDYRGDKMLTAPPFDVQTLAETFKALNFKVVSLLNLTQVEMLSAVYEFRELVGPGVYCVFYFCGHGFESSDSCFLVPVDAPTGYGPSSCIAADVIFNELLEREPSLCCMILDICRKRREDFASKPAFISECVKRVGHSIICFATCSGLAAYEGKKDGILVSHLKKFLHHPIGVEEVFIRLREELGKDTRVNNEEHKQIAEVKANLMEPRRSFTNEIKHNGFTSMYNKHRALWEQMHRKPDDLELAVPFPDFDFEVKVHLTFQQDHSNVLKIFTTVVDPGPTQQCMAYVCAISMEVAEKGDVRWVKDKSKRGHWSTFVSIKNVQRLKQNLTIKIAVKVILDGQMMEENTEDLDLPLPLVASLHLWRKRPPLGIRREAVEQDEFWRGDH